VNESTGTPGTPTEAPPVKRLGYAEAVELTIRIVHARAGRYRSLALAVVLTCTASLAWAGIARDWAPLLAFLLLFPFSAIFFHGDAALVSRWRRALLDLWADGQLDFEAFRSTIESVPSVPPTTVREMLQSIPKLGERDGAGRSSPTTRHALALTACAADDWATAKHVAVTLAYLSAFGLMIGALVCRCWKPMWGLPALPAAFAAAALVRALRLHGWRRRVRALQQDGLDLQEFIRLAQQISWPGVLPAKQDRLLASLR
jgi:hypothetical protein